MGLLITGLIIWSVIHFIPSLQVNLKSKLQDALGMNGYKAIFSVLIIISLTLIVFGWRSMTPTHLYYFDGASRHIVMIFIPIAFILFAASNYPTRIKQYIRHPQLMGVLIWAIAHLLLNGDSRSLILFVGLALWALLEIIFINKRDGKWIKPVKPSWKIEFIGLTITLFVMVLVMVLHPYIAGVAIK